MFNIIHPYDSSMITELELIHQGKVRDCFAVDDEHMMIVASDRLSAFDVVLPDPIPGKGEILTRLSNFFFKLTEDIIDNHLTPIEMASVVVDPRQRDALRNRSVIVKRLKPLPVEAVVRGFLIGSGWKDYQASGQVCGIELPAGLELADKLPRVLFTPSSKAPKGEHDENITFEAMQNLVGRELAEQVREASVELYRRGLSHAITRGVLIADTKFEFGIDGDGRLMVMDEMFTPDSSRFWAREQYRPGTSPPSFDKQYVRDYLESIGWDKKPPGPKLPQDVIDKTFSNYREAYIRLTGPVTEGGTDGWHLPPAR